MVQTLTKKEVDLLIAWGNFPRRLRRFFVAQNGKCAYCGRAVELRGTINRRERIYQREVIPSRDHVRPHRKGKGDIARLGNRVLACVWCNVKKGDRQPYPCEIFFVDVTTEIIIAMLPPADLKCYLGRVALAKREEANEQHV